MFCEGFRRRLPRLKHLLSPWLSAVNNCCTAVCSHVSAPGEEDVPVNSAVIYSGFRDIFNVLQAKRCYTSQVKSVMLTDAGSDEPLCPYRS